MTEGMTAGAAGLVIRAPQPGDVPALTALGNLPGVRAGTLRLPFTGEEALRRRLFEGGPSFHPAVGLLAGEPVAIASLLRGQGRRAHAGEVVLLVHDDHWGRGIGRAMIAAILDLADLWLGLTRLQLEVFADNASAIRLYERAGFEVEGRLRANTLSGGVLVDSLVMGCLRPAPRRQGDAPAAPAGDAR